MERRPLIKKPVQPESDYEEFRARIVIERNALDKATEEQAQVFLEVSERHARALSYRDEQRDALARRDAEIASNERRRLTKANEKVTDAIINDLVILHPDHQSLARVYGDAKHKAEQWGVLRDAFEQRMRMIKELVALYSSGYWTNTTITGSANGMRDVLAAQAREKMDQKRKERNRGE